ncbi:alkaline phosphatase family protein, partial [Jatrophihabitans endophyticus]|uniref:alkaline phosphatase family protein n=1 Tax=Jatrophihabitans endophyticus TaxID=1206085 RepID=UPI0019E59895
DAYIGNYGDNSLLYFDQYRNAKKGSPLHERARTGTNVAKHGTFFDQLRSDVVGRTLPQVSWIVAPEAFTEHPNWPANYGAWYVSKVLDALTADKDVWSRTALFLTYDENDGFFDHVVPAYPNGADAPGASTVATTHEHYAGPSGTAGHYGLGVRVPMLVVSPWSTGGWVCSETFDHTSLIRFIEARHGVTEPNITPWRRTVSGDLTAAFDFDRPKHPKLTLPSTAAYKPKDDKRHPDFVPTPPADPALPRQERGTRPSRALGYRLVATPTVDTDGLSVEIANRGRLGAALQARPAGATGVPSTYTVGAGKHLTATFPAAGSYDVSLHGPDGFFRRYAGSTTGAPVEVTMRESGSGRGQLVVHNAGSTRARVTVRDAHTGRQREHDVAAHGERSVVVDGGHTGGWYDLAVTVEGDTAFARHLAGRLASREHGTTDPLLGR